MQTLPMRAIRKGGNNGEPRIFANKLLLKNNVALQKIACDQYTQLTATVILVLDQALTSQTKT
jgi:hypothetical protein